MSTYTVELNVGLSLMPDADHVRFEKVADPTTTQWNAVTTIAVSALPYLQTETEGYSFYYRAILIKTAVPSNLESNPQLLRFPSRPIVYGDIKRILSIPESVASQDLAIYDFLFNAEPALQAQLSAGYLNQSDLSTAALIRQGMLEVLAGQYQEQQHGGAKSVQIGTVRTEFIAGGTVNPLIARGMARLELWWITDPTGLPEWVPFDDGDDAAMPTLNEESLRY